MQKILFDMHIADGYLATIPSQDSARKVGAAYYAGIYKKFGIDSVSYNRSLDYYYKHPDQFSKIYTVVVDKLMQAKVKTEKSDSLKMRKIEPKLEKPDTTKNALPRKL